ncbi:MAG TPA: glycosyltransferase family 1 protein [Planctomycetota bacterium]
MSGHRPGLAPARLAVDGTALDPELTGAGRRVACLLPRLATRGWEPVLFVSRDSGALWADLPGVETVPLPVPRHPAPLRAALARAPLARELRQRRATVLLTDVPPAPRALPFVLLVHDARAWDAPQLVSAGRRWWLRRTIPHAARAAAAVVTPSQATADRLQALFPGCTAQVVPNGCDHLPLDQHWSAGAEARADLLLAVGPWDRRKDLPTLLQAWSRLAPRPRLRLVGRPAGQLPDGVEAGPASDVELAGLYRRAAVTICPSRYEGFGLPLAEALAQGCPVVASDLPAHREVGGAVARYFAPGDVAALAAAISELRQEPGDPGPRLERAAGFSWRESASRMDAVLRQVCGLGGV